jgi:hypothetical protein
VRVDGRGPAVIQEVQYQVFSDWSFEIVNWWLL